MSEQIIIKTYDNHNISCLFDRCNLDKQSDTIIVITHGIFTDKHEKGRFDRLTKKLNDNGFDVIRFDFRGHGNSNLSFKYFTVSGALTDLITVFKWCEQFNYKNISTIGSSFGSSILLLERMLPNKRNLKSCVHLNPVVDYDDTFIYPKLRWGREIINIYKIREAEKKGHVLLTDDYLGSFEFINQLSTMHPYEGFKFYNSEVLVIHGAQDDKVPLETIKKISITNRKIVLEIIPNAFHAFKDPVIEKIVHDKTIKWLKG